MSKNSVRRPLKAGSWYESDGGILSEQLDEWLNSVDMTTSSNTPVRAVIAPHAGYNYSGPSAAFAYRQFLKQDVQKIRRVFLLGPSHHAYFDSCGLSEARIFQTPLGDITIDTETMNDLFATGNFINLSREVDEKEHSLELHLPYIFKCLKDIKLVPIMVGSLSKPNQLTFGKILSPYLDDPHTLFVISSDFCHWGERFSYTRYDNRHGPIHKSIEALDREAMNSISTLDPEVFRNYLSTTKNTICGRVPIMLLLQAIQSSKTKYQMEFIHYKQSSQCLSESDSSVSYAAGILSQI